MIRITLAAGVTGGFREPEPSLQVALVIKKDKSVKLTSHVKVNKNYVSTQSVPDFSSLEVSAFASDVISIFKNLPTESPPGSSDIYGFDISINIDSPDLRWENRPNSGCVASESSVKPSESQKQQFKAVADKLILFAQNYATVSVDA
ncbi:hypothetical protein HK098_007005 [Nowakowskiella sp. JEL0407]|nr:hypothetical protein HK098_007005 [Nowakowskiella sp. JEL0407]